MKFFKLSLTLAALSLFLLACGQNVTVNNAPNANRITQNVNGTTVSYDVAPTNAANSNGVANANSNSVAADPVADGKKIFSEKCVACHKENGEGGEVNIEGDKFKVPNFKDPKVVAYDDAKYKRYIVEGDDKMPSFKNKLSDAQIDGVIKYIRKEFQGK